MSVERSEVTYGPPVGARLDVEMITDTAGHLQSGGSGASGWGFNQSNLVRHGDDVYAMSWRDDLSLTVYRRVGPGRWEASPQLPPVPQNGNLLVDGLGRVHVIAGPSASYHAIFDPPGQVERYEILRLATADSRFGASIDSADRIFVAGGLSCMTWYLLDPEDGYRPAASGSVPHDANRGYNFAVLNGREAHSICGDDYFVRGEQYPNQSVVTLNQKTGELETIETQRGIYQQLKCYYYYCPDVVGTPQDWRMTVVSDVSGTFDGVRRGVTEQADIMFDARGAVHLLYYENLELGGSVWAGKEQDNGQSLMYHAVGPPGGPFSHVCLGGGFNGVRLYQGPDGRMHYVLTRGRRGDAEAVYYAVGEDGEWDRISEPVQVEMPSRFHHLFLNTTRAGGERTSTIDCYWTGAWGRNSQEAYYGRLTPEL